MFRLPRPFARGAVPSAVAAWLVLMPSSLLYAQISGGTPAPAAAAPSRIILFFGDSLTAGFGLDNPSAEAFPALIQQRLTAAGLRYTAVNAGVSGDTSAGGLRRIDWAMRQPIDILVLALGANDGLRGVPVAETSRNLQGIIDRVKARNPAVRVLVAGMRMPPSLGAEYIARFADMYPELVKANPGATLMPFLLQGVAGIARYNQRDQIHPTAEGHRLIADALWPLLEPMCRNVPAGG